MAEHSLRSIKNPIWKIIIRYIILVSWVNAPLVAILKALSFTKSWRGRIPIRLGRSNYRLPNKESIWLYNRGRCDVSKELFWNDGALHTPSDQLSLKIALVLAAKTDLYLDIGAYTGLYAMAVSKYHPSVISYAYEIVPENYLLLIENVVKNNLINEVKPKICGISSAKGNIAIPYTFGSGVMASSIALDWTFDGGVNIPLDALDCLHKGFSGKVSMKIDVECFEWHVLSGAKHILTNLKPDIVCEILTRATSIPNIQEFLRPLGYNFFHITSEGLLLCSEIKPVKHERDWLFTIKTIEDLKGLGLPVL